MTFGEKVKLLREKKSLTQKQLGDLLGVSMRTVQSYEAGKSYPRQRSIYEKMAKLFEVEENYLLVENEPSFSDSEKADLLVEKIRRLWTGGTLSDEKRDEMMEKLQETYWEAKRGSKKDGS